MTENTVTQYNIEQTHVMDKYLGIINQVVPHNSYATPLVLSNDNIYMNGRTFRVLETNLAELSDYNRYENNSLTRVQANETDYFLKIAKFWGVELDDLDAQDLNQDVINYQVAKQTAKVVAPYLDELRFETAIKNAKYNITVTADNYDDVLSAGVKLDEQGDVNATRYLFVTPEFYKSIKKQIVTMPQGDANQTVLFKGYVGELDGATVIKVPTKFLDKTGNVKAILSVGELVISPVQVDQTKYGDTGAGKFGKFVQQLIYTGAFVLKENQSKIITISTTAPTNTFDGEEVEPKAETTPTGKGKTTKAAKATQGV